MSVSRYPKRERTTDSSSDDTSYKIAKTASSSTETNQRGRRLLPAVIEELAHGDLKDQPWISVAKSNGTSIEYEDLSYAQFASAVDRAANWLAAYLKPESGTVAAYLGPSDARYLLLTIAASKLGCVLFLPSPHNPVDSQRALLSASKCQVFLHATSSENQVNTVVESTNLKRVLVPEQAEWFVDRPCERVLYNKTYDEEKYKPFVILHTSGTTGSPKPVVLPHAYYAYEDLSRSTKYTESLEVITSSPFAPGVRCLITAPLWHAGGIFFGLLKPILNGLTAVLPPAGLPITSALVHSCLTLGRVQVWQTMPSVAAEMVQDPKHAPVVKALDAIILGSGPLSTTAGDKLLSVNRNTLHFFGLTETDLLPLLRLDDPTTQWPYHRFHPLSGATLQPLGDGLHELVIKRVEEAPQPCFAIFPDLDMFSTKDIFTQHPTNKDCWRFEGRLDDVLTFSTGEKASVQAFENTVSGYELVHGALVVGRAREQPALLLEAAQGTSRQIIEAVWPYVQEANKHMPSFARVEKHLIAVTALPFSRTPKGTIKRLETEKQLSAEIDGLYNDQQNTAAAPSLGVTTSADDVYNFVAAAHASASNSTPLADADIFASGLDSMGVAKLVNSLNKGLAKSRDPAARATRVTPAHLYSHRSISGVAKALHSDIGVTKAGHKQKANLRPHHGALLQKHIGKLPRKLSISVSLPGLPPVLNVVALTGSTGNLGTHLLHAILREPKVMRVHCLDRSASSRTAYLETFPEDAVLLLKVSFHQVKALEEARFGLSQHTYTELCNSVTSVIHNAWPVNFQLPLEASDTQPTASPTMNPHVGGVSTLVDFAAAAKHRPRIVFISTLAAVLRYSSPDGKVPEAVVAEPSAPENSGYAQSKWMGEQILQAAAETHAIRRPVVVRVGQIAGPLPHVKVVRGSGSIWQTDQVIPSMILSSKAIAALPETLGEKNKIRWIPVDVCARIILELTGCPEAEKESSSASVFNITNLARVDKELSWTADILPLVRKRMEKFLGSQSVQVLPLQDWVDKMIEYGSRSDNPAFRLLNFFEDLAVSEEHAGLGGNIVVAKAEAASKSFRELGPVRPEWIEYWMNGWAL